MHTDQRPAKVLKGLSFEIDDLIHISNLSEGHGLRMVVGLDHGSNVEEYEEVLIFSSMGLNPQWFWKMWRNASAVFVRSIDGRSRRYETADQAIRAVLRNHRMIVTDIKATHWPSV